MQNKIINKYNISVCIIVDLIIQLAITIPVEIIPKMLVKSKMSARSTKPYLTNNSLAKHVWTRSRTQVHGCAAADAEDGHTQYQTKQRSVKWRLQPHFTQDTCTFEHTRQHANLDSVAFSYAAATVPLTTDVQIAARSRKLTPNSGSKVIRAK